MKILDQIAKLGNPVLRMSAEKVANPQSTLILEIIENMYSILADTNGVGLAAPQIGQSFCIMIIASHPSKRYPYAPEMEPMVMINPEFVTQSEEQKKDWEGCLSIPGIRALVPRYTAINITYLDQQGIEHEWYAEGFLARIFQHEFDHFNGLVFLDRVCCNKDIISEVEFQKLI